MPRPRRKRCIRSCPNAALFKPQGVRLREIEIIDLAADEYEAYRLVHHESMQQDAAAKKMGISQPTLHRTLRSAHEKIARMLVKGLALQIETRAIETRQETNKANGGEHMPNKDGTGPDGDGPMTGRKMGPCNPDQPAAQPRRGKGAGRGRMGGRPGRGAGRGFGRGRQ